MLLKDKLMTALTLWCTFLMGYLDTYAFLHYDDLLVSAQTGNLVLLGANLRNELSDIMPHVASFGGFLLGAFLAEALLEYTAKNSSRKFSVFIFIQVIVLFGVASFESLIGVYGFAVILGAFSGYTLTIFNRVGATKMNNGIMTGNVQKLMTQLYRVIFLSEKDAWHVSRVILIGVMTFIVGIFMSALLYIYLSEHMMMIAACLSVLVFVVLVMVGRRVSET